RLVLTQAQLMAQGLGLRGHLVQAGNDGQGLEARMRRRDSPSGGIHIQQIPRCDGCSDLAAPSLYLMRAARVSPVPQSAELFQPPFARASHFGGYPDTKLNKTSEKLPAL
ncbi:hypothetical protein, partial [Roseateles flavus]